MTPDVARPAGTPATGRQAQRARSLARLLDHAVHVPGTRIGFGLDGLLGLIPGLGDAAGGALSLYILVLAWRAGVPGPVLVRMALNIGIDVLIGIIPLIGDLADFAFKANLRNIDLLDRALADPTRVRRASVIWLIALVAFVVLLIVAIITLVASLIAAIVSVLT